MKIPKLEHSVEKILKSIESSHSFEQLNACDKMIFQLCLLFDNKYDIRVLLEILRKKRETLAFERELRNEKFYSFNY